MSSAHEVAYAALATVLFTYAFSSLSIIFMIEYKFAKSSAATTKSHKKSPRRVVEEGQCGTVVGVRPQLQPHRTAVAHFCYTKACWRLPLDDPRHMYDACSVRLGRLPHSISTFYVRSLRFEFIRVVKPIYIYFTHFESFPQDCANNNKSYQSDYKQAKDDFKWGILDFRILLGPSRITVVISNYP